MSTQQLDDVAMHIKFVFSKKATKNDEIFTVDLTLTQRYTYRVLQTIQMKLILLSVWAELAVLGKSALKFKYEI